MVVKLMLSPCLPLGRHTEAKAKCSLLKHTFIYASESGSTDLSTETESSQVSHGERVIVGVCNATLPLMPCIQSHNGEGTPCIASGAPTAASELRDIAQFYCFELFCWQLTKRPVLPKTILL